MHALGKHITPGLDDGVHGKGPRQTVGIVGDVKLASLTKDAPATYYLPLAQALITLPNLVIRTAGDPVRTIAPLGRLLTTPARENRACRGPGARIKQ
jgi:hypothetical protein